MTRSPTAAGPERVHVRHVAAVDRCIPRSARVSRGAQSIVRNGIGSTVFGRRRHATTAQAPFVGCQLATALRHFSYS